MKTIRKTIALLFLSGFLLSHLPGCLIVERRGWPIHHTTRVVIIKPGHHHHHPPGHWKYRHTKKW